MEHAEKKAQARERAAAVMTRWEYKEIDQQEPTHSHSIADGGLKQQSHMFLLSSASLIQLVWCCSTTRGQETCSPEGRQVFHVFAQRTHWSCMQLEQELSYNVSVEVNTM